MQQTPDWNELMRIAKSPAGQQLLQLLQQNAGNGLEQLAKDAAAGNWEKAKGQLLNLLSSQEAQRLLTQLEKQP